jgi:glyoxylase-like metal-dependent hydrolase (beta-lactamase superfamily II)
MDRVYHVGNATITRIPELILDSNSPEYLYPQWDPAFLLEHEHWLVPENMDRTRTHVIQSIHTWLIRTKQHAILIDTATGNDKERVWFPRLNRLKTPYLERLKDAGVTPEMVDYVILTHLHVDHVGWNTRRDGDAWIPTFPNATYVFSKAEQHQYSNPENYPENSRVKFVIYDDSVLPVVKAGRAKLVDPDGSEFLSGIFLHPVPGHTCGQMAVGLTSCGKEALFGGDVMHHPIQVYRPEWNSIYCEEAEKARDSRRWVLEYLADRHALYFSSHFAGTSAGRVARTGTGFRWKFC